MNTCINVLKIKESKKEKINFYILWDSLAIIHLYVQQLLDK